MVRENLVRPGPYRLQNNFHFSTSLTLRNLSNIQNHLTSFPQSLILPTPNTGLSIIGGNHAG